MTVPRVAFFTDSFHEVNGVALTSREFAGFAHRRGYPFLSVHTGPETKYWAEGEFETHEIQSSSFRLGLEKDLAFDMLFARHLKTVRESLLRFRPDLVHITGPGHLGLLGLILAEQHHIPMAASWHTNVHEFGARRLENMLAGFPGALRRAAGRFSEDRALDLTLMMYQRAKVCYAPNPELVQLIHTRTHRPTHLMRRGIDTSLYSPDRRTHSGDPFVIGYVGRLSPEKNVRILADIEKKLIEAGVKNYRFLVVGHGGEREWLADHLKSAELPGVLRGVELARAYANMDAFLFPSETDTFGNVVLEALASGVPAVVSSGGGPKFIVGTNGGGFVAGNVAEYAEAIMKLYRDPELRQSSARAARQRAMSFSWDAVFEEVYQGYNDIPGLMKSQEARAGSAATLAATTR